MARLPGGSDRDVEHRSPIAGTIDDGGRPEALGGKGQDDAPPDVQAGGDLQPNQVRATCAG